MTDDLHRVTPAQICRINESLGGDGVPRHPLLLPVTDALAHASHDGTLDYPDPVDRAAYLLLHIAFDGVFQSANAATAFVTADVYLRAYGYHLDLEPEYAIPIVDQIARGYPPLHLVARRLRGWLRNNHAG